MFGKYKKNSYDDTSVVEQGGKEYGSDIHGVALSVNKIVWDMLKVLKDKKLFGFHFSAKLGVKNTIVIMTHEDRETLNKGQKLLHGFQDNDGIIILAKVYHSNGSQKKILEEDSSNALWKSKTGLSTVISTMLILSATVYYMTKYTQEDKQIFVEKNSTIAKKEIEINIQMMNALSKGFDNKENKKVKEVLAQVLEISTSTDILTKIPGYEKVELDNNEIVSAYEDPNLKYVIKDGNGTMKKLNEMAQAYAKENNITQAKGMLKELIQIGKEARSKGVESHEGIAKNLNTLGDVSLQDGDIKGAEASFAEALKIDKKLEIKNPRRYEMRVARDLTNLGVIQVFKNDKKRAKQLYTEAEKRYKRIVELYRNLVKKEPKTYTAHLAYSLNNLASLYLNREQNISKAIEPSEEALAIYKKLDKTEPKKYSEFLVLTLHKTASIYNKEKKFKTAQKLYTELIDYCKKGNSIEYDEHIAKSLNALALIHTKEPKLRDLKKAKAQLNEAIRLYKRVMKKSSKSFNKITSLSYSNLGYIASMERESKIASKMYEKAIETFDSFDNRISYAIFLSEDKRYKDANRIFKSIVKKYTEKEQQAYALMSYGEFYREIDEVEGSKKLEKSLELYRELSREDRFSYLEYEEKIEGLLDK